MAATDVFLVKEDCVLDEETASLIQQPQSKSQVHHHYWRCFSWSNVIVLALVVLLLAQHVIQDSNIQKLRQQQCQSPHAGLAKDTPVPWAAYGKWVDDDRAIEDAVWNDPGLHIDSGFVAIPDRFAREHNLVLSQRWPWDKEKGIYLLGASHDVHCIKQIRGALLNAFDGKPIGIDYHHLKHCLSILMQDTLCHADDSLLYTGRIYENQGATVPKSGLGQYRYCRSWSKLQAWASQHSACFSSANRSKTHLIENYKFCPDGRTPWLHMK